MGRRSDFQTPAARLTHSDWWELQHLIDEKVVKMSKTEEFVVSKGCARIN
jgi:hypothetical protein